ncbi:MAG: hypothetical protein BroJett007_35550 [Chloroflexota bacterium]|nr:MAG: hypothetical protein BroJett007_35550 [Chloroflexota bacterium]
MDVVLCRYTTSLLYDRKKKTKGEKVLSIRAALPPRVPRAVQEIGRNVALTPYRETQRQHQMNLRRLFQWADKVSTAWDGPRDMFERMSFPQPRVGVEIGVCGDCAA